MARNVTDEGTRLAAAERRIAELEADVAYWREQHVAGRIANRPARAVATGPSASPAVDIVRALARTRFIGPVVRRSIRWFRTAQRRVRGRA